MLDRPIVSWMAKETRNNDILNKTKECSPFPRKLDLGITTGHPLSLFVDGTLLILEAARLAAIVGAGAYVDFFLAVDSGVWQGRSRGSDSSIFPSDARSAIEIDFSLYSGLSSLRDSVTPVRRREDTEGDGDARLKVQIDCLWASFLECLSNCLKQPERRDKKRLTDGSSLSSLATRERDPAGYLYFPW